MADLDLSSQIPWFYPIRGKFIVRNISKDHNKTIRIFDYPILYGKTRDILRIPTIGEGDIRDSLLKGTLRNKLMAGEIEIVDSDIDLIQFNEEQKVFLQEAGIVEGLEVGSNQLTVEVSDIISAVDFSGRREQVTLIGVINGLNTIFQIPTDLQSGTSAFDVSENHMIQVYRNGVRQYYLDDYYIAESGGVGSGYNRIIFSIPPSTIDGQSDIITADYWIPNP